MIEIRGADDPASAAIRPGSGVVARGPDGHFWADGEVYGKPVRVRVAPGAQERGTAVVSRPLSRSATSLLVRLKELPFGEASFVVSLNP